jgi:hypothetical protein
MVTFHMRQRSPLVGFCVRQCAVADDNTEIIGLGDNYTGSSNCRSPDALSFGMSLTPWVWSASARGSRKLRRGVRNES